MYSFRGCRSPARKFMGHLLCGHVVLVLCPGAPHASAAHQSSARVWSTWPCRENACTARGAEGRPLPDFRLCQRVHAEPSLYPAGYRRGSANRPREDTVVAAKHRPRVRLVQRVVFIGEVDCAMARRRLWYMRLGGRGPYPHVQHFPWWTCWKQFARLLHHLYGRATLVPTSTPHGGGGTSRWCCCFSQRLRHHVA